MDDCKLRVADRLLHHLKQVEKSFQQEKKKVARASLIDSALEGRTEGMKAVQAFKEDGSVLEVFLAEAKQMLRGLITKARYNMCLGLLAARLMLW